MNQPTPNTQHRYEDEIGAYDLSTFTWTAAAPASTPGAPPPQAPAEPEAAAAAAATTTVVTSFRLYDPDAAPAAMFAIAFPNGATGTAQPPPPPPSPASPSPSLPASASAPAAPKTSTAFPSWSRSKGKLPKLGSLSWSGTFVASLSEDVGAPRATDDNESPTVLYEAHNGTTAVFSAANNFMAMAQDSDSDGGSTWQYGVSAEVLSLPAGFEFRTLFYADGGGITSGIDSWGNAMKALHNTTKIADSTLNTLGYMTDRGAYYYWYANPPNLHKPDQIGLPERKFIELSQHFKAAKVPVGYYQLDAWWYHCDGWNACIADFSPHKDYFPSGLAALTKNVGKLKEWPGGENQKKMHARHHTCVDN